MRLSRDNIINLEDYRVRSGSVVSKVFTGRDRGLYVRENCKIDEIEAKYDSVQIIIPDGIRSINPSFFEELFKNVVLKLGEEKFLVKFIFISKGSYNYKRPLNEAIQRILRDNTALG